MVISDTSTESSYIEEGCGAWKCRESGNIRHIKSRVILKEVVVHGNDDSGSVSAYGANGSDDS